MATIEELQEALAQAEIELADKAFYVREFAAVCQERDALKAERDNLRTGWENSHRAEEELERAKAELHDAKIALDGKEVQIAGLKLSDKAIARELAEAKAELHDWKIGRYRAVVPGPEHCGIAHGVVVEPVRVPFTDAQIEKMAAAYYEDRWSKGKWAWLNPMDRAATKSAIRAALAAGGIEPCPAPEGEPAEVKWTEPTDAQIEALARVLRDAYRKECHFGPADTTPNTGYIAEARAAFAHLRQTQGNVLAAERQATVWSGPTRAEAEKKWNEINTRLASSHLSDSQDFRDWLLPLLPETRVEDGTTYRRNPANDGFVDMPTDAKVEALAMALCDATCETGFWDSPSCSRSTWTDAARAAFAHIGAVDSALEGE